MKSVKLPSVSHCNQPSRAVTTVSFSIPSVLTNTTPTENGNDYKLTKLSSESSTFKL